MHDPCAGATAGVLLPGIHRRESQATGNLCRYRPVRLRGVAELAIVVETPAIRRLVH